eukprot:537218-Prymnesium_polylepis.1
MPPHAALSAVDHAHHWSDPLRHHPPPPTMDVLDQRGGSAPRPCPRPKPNTRRRSAYVNDVRFRFHNVHGRCATCEPPRPFGAKGQPVPDWGLKPFSCQKDESLEPHTELSTE